MVKNPEKPHSAIRSLLEESYLGGFFTEFFKWYDKPRKIFGYSNLGIVARIFLVYLLIGWALFSLKRTQDYQERLGASIPILIVFYWIIIYSAKVKWLNKKSLGFAAIGLIGLFGFVFIMGIVNPIVAFIYLILVYLYILLLPSKFMPTIKDT